MPTVFNPNNKTKRFTSFLSKHPQTSSVALGVEKNIFYRLRPPKKKTHNNYNYKTISYKIIGLNFRVTY